MQIVASLTQNKKNYYDGRDYYETVLRLTYRHFRCPPPSALSRVLRKVIPIELSPAAGLSHRAGTGRQGKSGALSRQMERAAAGLVPADRLRGRCLQVDGAGPASQGGKTVTLIHCD